MAEYIEREATLNVLRNLGSRDYRREKGTIADAMKMIMHSAYTPTADVAEVKHGKWIYHECVLSYDGTISGHSCSVCKAFVNEETFDNDTFYKKYCGNCGARMDGDGE